MKSTKITAMIFIAISTLCMSSSINASEDASSMVNSEMAPQIANSSMINRVYEYFSEFDLFHATFAAFALSTAYYYCTQDGEDEKTWQLNAHATPDTFWGKVKHHLKYRVFGQLSGKNSKHVRVKTHAPVAKTIKGFKKHLPVLTVLVTMQKTVDEVGAGLRSVLRRDVPLPTIVPKADAAKSAGEVKVA